LIKHLSAYICSLVLDELPEDGETIELLVTLEPLIRCLEVISETS
jgi:hypothetical protein